MLAHPVGHGRDRGSSGNRTRRHHEGDCRGSEQREPSLEIAGTSEGGPETAPPDDRLRTLAPPLRADLDQERSKARPTAPRAVSDAGHRAAKGARPRRSARTRVWGRLGRLPHSAGLSRVDGRVGAAPAHRFLRGPHANGASVEGPSLERLAVQGAQGRSSLMRAYRVTPALKTGLRPQIALCCRHCGRPVQRRSILTARNSSRLWHGEGAGRLVPGRVFAVR